LCPHDHKPDVSDQRKRTALDAPQVPLPGRPVPPQAQSPGRRVLRLITLQFLGSTTPQQYECVTAGLRELHQPPVSIAFGAIGTFDRAGVLFVDVRVSPQLVALQQAVTAATAPCGFVPETRPYHPHITLARRKGKGGGEELRNLKLQIGRQPDLSSFTAESFLLYESIPTPEGSRYEVRERFSLRGRHGE
jgi:2'-5' RNA ligase